MVTTLNSKYLILSCPVLKPIQGQSCPLHPHTIHPSFSCFFVVSILFCSHCVMPPLTSPCCFLFCFCIFMSCFSMESSFLLLSKHCGLFLFLYDVMPFVVTPFNVLNENCIQGAIFYVFGSLATRNCCPHPIPWF